MFGEIGSLIGIAAPIVTDLIYKFLVWW